MGAYPSPAKDLFHSWGHDLEVLITISLGLRLQQKWMLDKNDLDKSSPNALPMLWWYSQANEEEYSSPQLFKQTET